MKFLIATMGESAIVLLLNSIPEMSTDRYEIRGKIGQGGVGAVYRAYDTQLRREVAMKRVLQDSEMNTEDATANLLKEATALSSVQHPHIVTVYDAGIDAEGPYVVMEMINGKTLDEMVERGTLTFEDFKEVALQSQEAMIAAQDLDLVHRDLKPSNVMVSWLPSGRFQVKIVDFGLAKFSAKPSLQTIDHGDAVFGSIFFMAPEQFERTPLDRRTDMYSLGAMYYYALAGDYPFNGDTAPQVMAAHLQNKVTPLIELRPDLPVWVCDWVMWHIRRDMSDRPESARVALEHFLAHDSAHTLNVTSAQPLAGTATGTVATANPNISGHTAPQPILSPGGQVNPHTAAQKLAPSLVAATPGTGTTPTTPAATPAAASAPAAEAQPAAESGPAQDATPAAPVVAPPKISAKALSVIAAVLVIAIGSVLFLMLSKSDDQKMRDLYEGVVAQYDENKPREPIALTDKELNALLQGTASDIEGMDKSTCYNLLAPATAKNEKTNVDKYIATFATQEGRLPDGVRSTLFEKVLALRARAASSRTEAYDIILTWAGENSDHAEVSAAIRSLQDYANEGKDFEGILKIAQGATNSGLLKACGTSLTAIVERSSNKPRLAKAITNAYRATTSENCKGMLIKVAAHTGATQALEILREGLKSSDPSIVNNTFYALANWPNREAISVITKKIKSSDITDKTDLAIRKSGFNAVTKLLTSEKIRNLEGNNSHWSTLTDLAANDTERYVIIVKLGGIHKKWALPILRRLKSESSGNTADKAQKAIDDINDHL